jgi:hypothetical protein
VLFVKQHWIMDVFSGIVISELCFLLMTWVPPPNFVERLITKINVNVKLEPLSMVGKTMKYKSIPLKQYRVNIILYVALILVVLFAVIYFSIGAF